MSWITDWTGSLWTVCLDTLKAPFVAVLDWWNDWLEDQAPIGLRASFEKYADKAAVAPGKVSMFGEMVGTLVNIMGIAKVLGEPNVQRVRRAVLKGERMYPLEAKEAARFSTWLKTHPDYLAYLQDLSGGQRDTLAAFHELSRQRPDLAALRTLYNRGLVTGEYVDECLAESGFVDMVKEFLPTAEGYEWETKDVERTDRAFVKRLFEQLPDIGSLISMEVRDAFPIDPAIYPAEERDEVWQRWFTETNAHKPRVYGWEKGTGVGVTDALKEDSEFGPQSFPSWFLGARKRFSETFKAAASAQGLDPYWAMKAWEAHWQLPGFQMARELLFRSPKFTAQRFRDTMRWQDFPPDLVAELERIAYQPLTRVDVRRMHLRGVLSAAAVFKAYLDLGYNTTNAAYMTGFTVVWNADRQWGKVVDAIAESYVEGVITEGDALAEMVKVLAAEVPTEVSEEVAADLSEEQVAAALRSFEAVGEQLSTFVTDRLTKAKYDREWGRLESKVETAKSMFTTWRWIEEQARGYLGTAGLVTARIDALIEDWEPERERREKLPTRGMLEDFLITKRMTVEQWHKQMGKLGYDDATVEAILQGVGRLPTRGMLERFLVAHVIDASEYRHYMTRLGYAPQVITYSLAELGPAFTES